MGSQKSANTLGISKKRSIQLKKMMVIIACWLVVGMFITIYDHFLISSELAAGYGEDYTFLKNLAFNLAAAFLGASLGSLWLVLYVGEKLRDKPYGKTWLMVALSFFVIVGIIAVSLGIGFVRYETGQWPLFNASATEALQQNLSNPFHLKNMVVWANVVLLTQFGLQINDKFGQGLLPAFISGKYHRPKKEKRVFMFVDLINSTGIAETLGNEKYYGLLKDFFADITDSIIYNGGNIYQYVGDEVVISWKCDKKVIHHNFLNCYFDMRKAIKDKHDIYTQKYGLVPDFKAASHYGDVTVGEIGIIKRDLTFSGDVLNTAARIMTFCSKYEKKLLISEKLVQYIAPLKSPFEFTSMGEEQLRGKSEMTKIYAVVKLD